MQRRGLCCHVLGVVCGPGLRLLLQAAGAVPLAQLQLASLKKASCMKRAQSGSVGAASQGPAAA